MKQCLTKTSVSLPFQVTTPSSQVSGLQICKLKVLKVKHWPYQKASTIKWPGLKTFGSPHFPVAGPLQPHSHWGSEVSKPKHQITASKLGFVYLIRSKANRVLHFSLPVKYKTCSLHTCLAISKSTHLLSLISTDQFSEVQM